MSGFNYVVGTIGGGALSADADPNVTPPAAARTFKLPNLSFFPPHFRAFALNGTTIQATLWAKDDGTGKWVKLSSTVTATPSSPGVDASVGRLPNGTGFVQLTTNTGVEAVGVLYT